MILKGQRTSTAIALLALFVALGGTSYAAIKIPSKSVGTKQLKAGAVTSAAIKDGTVTAKDLAAGSIPAGPAGARGARGPEGPVGPQGPSSSAGGQVYIDRPDTRYTLGNSAQGRTLVATVTVPAGSYALDFGADTFNVAAATFVDCAMEADGRGIQATATTLGREPGGALEATISLTDATTFNRPATVNVFCSQRTSSFEVIMAQVRLRALKVSVLEEQ